MIKHRDIFDVVLVTTLIGCLIVIGGLYGMMPKEENKIICPYNIQLDEASACASEPILKDQH